MAEERYQQGLAVKRALFGEGKESPVPPGHLAEDLLRLTDELVFGGIYTRPGLPLKIRSMITVAALCVLGKDDYLRRHLQGALHIGVTPEEIKEILMQMAFYGGVPCALRGLRIAQEEIAAWQGGPGAQRRASSSAPRASSATAQSPGRSAGREAASRPLRKGPRKMPPSTPTR